VCSYQPTQEGQRTRFWTQRREGRGRDTETETGEGVCPEKKLVNRSIAVRHTRGKKKGRTGRDENSKNNGPSNQKGGTNTSFLKKTLNADLGERKLQLAEKKKPIPIKKRDNCRKERQREKLVSSTRKKKRQTLQRVFKENEYHSGRPKRK